MISVAVIQELLSVLFLLGLFSFCAAIKQRRIAVWAPAIQPYAIAAPGRAALFFSAIHIGKETDPLGTPAMQRALRSSRVPSKTHSSMAGDWLAPLIVWFLVITVSLAIAGFLLGER